jgi:hypothetical protein
MNRTQRVTAFAAALVAGVASMLVFAGPASAYTPLSCQTRTANSDTAPHESMSYYAPGGFWKFGHFYASKCRAGTVNWEPYGFRLTRNGVVEARIRTYNSNGNTWYTTGWVTSYGYGTTVKLTAMLTPGTRFAIELRVRLTQPYMSDRPGEWWPKGQGEY